VCHDACQHYHSILQLQFCRPCLQSASILQICRRSFSKGSADFEVSGEVDGGRRKPAGGSTCPPQLRTGVFRTRWRRGRVDRGGIPQEAPRRSSCWKNLCMRPMKATICPTNH
jgi:hypothetical protein